ncbi:TetR/AcrR family transcriptional regulator [Spirosoma arcticum]|nr:TetR/AcrR family transcriptional regulator [Fibrella sp.]
MQDTQQRIIEAAIAVLNDDLSASMDKIALQAGVTRRTLHRYFDNRQDLYKSCLQEMWRSCQQATSAAYASSPDAQQQLKHLLYASIDCGKKYAFLHKFNLVQAPSPVSAGEVEPIQLLQGVVMTLQRQGMLNPELTVPWILALFLGVVQATIQAETTGTVAKHSIKELAWLSFSQGIGLRTYSLIEPSQV